MSNTYLFQPPHWAVCWACGEPLIARTKRGVFCSSACRAWAYRQRLAHLPWHFLRRSVTPSARDIERNPTAADILQPQHTEANGSAHVPLAPDPSPQPPDTVAIPVQLLDQVGGVAAIAGPDTIAPQLLDQLGTVSIITGLDPVPVQLLDQLGTVSIIVDL